MQVIFFEEPGTTYHKGNTKENSRKFHSSFPPAISHVYVFPSATAPVFFLQMHKPFGLLMHILLLSGNSSQFFCFVSMLLQTPLIISLILLLE